MLTVPVAVLSILMFFESTKEFSASNYEVSSQYDYGDLEIKSPAASVEERVIDMPDLGYASFSEEVPIDVAATVIADFYKTRRKNPKADVPTTDPFAEFQKPLGTAQTRDRWQFTVRKKLNKLKLTELVAASLAIPALLIQGFISIAAWIVRGFKD